MKTLILFLMLSASVVSVQASGGGGYYATSVYVKFMSTGSGINRVALEKLKSLLLVGTNTGEVLTAKQRSLGREGERVICVQLREQGSRYAFIRRLAPSIVNDKMSNGLNRTEVYVGFSCDDIKKASLQNLSFYYP
jgi:hypothetical protein